MITEIVRGNSPQALAQAVAILKAGGIVAFPNETVYGLGADAKNPDAIAKIFAAKGRPANNPLIVHCLDKKMAQSCVEGWTQNCNVLADAFWPGPLTLVLARGPMIPNIVTASGPTLAVRVPKHLVARALLAHYDAPIAAPSANRSTGISPTRAEHVLTSLGGKIPLILDGGACSVGLESTVISMVEDPPCILRQGGISQAEIEEVLGQTVAIKRFDEQTPQSPGMMRRHYAPTKRLQLFRVGAQLPDRSLVVICRAETELPENPQHLLRRLPNDPQGFARDLYAALYWADEQAPEMIFVEAPPPGKPWDAVRDRLSRSGQT